MIIAPERPADIDAIFKLTQRAFLQMAFSDGSEGQILAALRTEGDLALSLVAREADVIIGHAAFSAVQIDGEHGGWYGLGPISVEPARQREGIGRALVDAGLKHLAAQGAKGCALIGNPDIYARLGFRTNKRLLYGDVPPEVVQFRTLSGRDPEGQLTFARAFDAQR